MSCTEVLSKIACFEKWCMHKMHRLSLTASRSNLDVRRLMCGQPSLFKDIKEKQLCFRGHVITKQQLEELAITGRKEGKNHEESTGLCSYNSFREVQALSSMLPEVENLGSLLQMRQSTSVNRYDAEIGRSIMLRSFGRKKTMADFTKSNNRQTIFRFLI